MHTTYPTVTSDGRVLYTRWDYNDRNQMYIQAVFQMYADGTNQTELYGNDINWPTTLLHTREIYGSRNKYITVISGHHVDQAGQLAVIDLDKGADNPDAVEFIFDNAYKSRKNSQDKDMMTGYLYKYPYAINENELLYAKTRTSNSFNGGFATASTIFDLYYYNRATKEETLLMSGDSTYHASQIVPIVKRNLYNRTSFVDYGSDTSTYYVSNVYEGKGTPGVEKGSIKYLRVIALKYRPYSIGAIANGALSYNGIYYAGADPHTPVGSAYTSWDVKDVIGLATVYEDGSALFNVPSETPLFFQLLDEDYHLVQSMRSWSTLQPGETYSCVGCHEQSGSTPIGAGGVTMAMKAGVEELSPDLWMDASAESYEAKPHETGFSYLETIQPILDAKCISCHHNISKVYTVTGTSNVDNYTELFPLGSYWYYKIQTGVLSADTFSPEKYSTTGYTYARAGFGTAGDARAPSVCYSSAVDWSSGYGYFQKEFTLSAAQAAEGLIILWQYDENPVLYINGRQVLTTGSGQYISSPKMQTLSIPAGLLREGKNVIAVRLENKLGGRYFDLGLYSTLTSAVAETGPISLESTKFYGSREKMYYPASYLVLTGSVATSDYYSANWRTNRYINWIPAISQCEILLPYQFGSASSDLLKLLRNESENFPNHPAVQLTEQEIAAFACWIDLACPLRGAYAEEGKFSATDLRVIEELQTKQDFYRTLDNVTKDILGGVRDDTHPVTVSYTTSAGVVSTLTDTGLVDLYLGKSYSSGAKIEIKLPKGCEYVWMNLQPRIAPQLLYAKDGKITLTLTTQMLSSFPKHLKGNLRNHIYVWLPTDEEITANRNLAYAPFANNQTSGVSVKASNTYDSSAEFHAVNAVDGFRNNRGHGAYPVQSWGPAENPTNLSYTVSFGRTVKVDRLRLTIRGDFDDQINGYAAGDHDTYITSVTAVFLDEKGNTLSQKQFTGLRKTKDPQELLLDKPVECASVKLTNFVKNKATWFAISELEIFGADFAVEQKPILLGDVNDDGLVTIRDVTALLGYIASGNLIGINVDACDMNGDGICSIVDVTGLLTVIANQ